MTPSSLSEKAQSYLHALENSFFWRWITNYKISFMIIILLIFYGIYTIFIIPKESFPEIKFWIVWVTTVYPGANPSDIDDLITTKIENAVKDLDGISSIDSTSSLWVSNVILTLDNGVDTKEFITDVRNKVDVLSFAEDVTTPNVMEMNVPADMLFQVVLYAPKEKYSMNHLRTLARQFVDDIEGTGGIEDVTINGLSHDDSASEFSLQIELNATQLQQQELTVGQVMNQIRAYNQNLPLWNYALGALKYDYRIDNKLTSLADLQSLPIQLNHGWYTTLEQLSSIVRHYSSDTVEYGWTQGTADNHAVSLIIYKKAWSNVFSTSNSAREVIESTLAKFIYSDLSVAYTQDLASEIVDDYLGLARDGFISIILVFLITTPFIGRRQSMIATLSMPIAFFITFMILNSLDMSMNFMVNFSLILSFGMGVDTVIVFVESAQEYMKQWYNPKTAILLTMKTYAKPNIISALVNIMVFLPILLLPWIMGKFLAFIPITIFATLVGSLLLALTVNNALVAKFNKPLPYYYKEEDNDIIDSMSSEEKEILTYERTGKQEKEKTEWPWLEKTIDRIRDKYILLLRRILPNRLFRKIAVFWPVGLVVLTFIALAPMIGFTIFPTGDTPNMSFSVEAQEGTDVKEMINIMSWVDALVAQTPELQTYIITIKDSLATIWMTLVAKSDRDRDSFEIQDDVKQQLSYLTRQWYKVEGTTEAGGPPTGKAVGIKIIADDKQYLSGLQLVAKDFESYLNTLTGTVNVASSSKDTPGQFSFRFDQSVLAQLWLTPNDVQSDIYSSINGLKAWSMIVDNKERDIVVKVNTFVGEVSPEDVYNLTISTRQWPILLSEIAKLSVDPSLSSIVRSDTDITITVDSDVQNSSQTAALQLAFEQFAKNYEYPEGISYAAWWENEENAELIGALGTALLISIFLTIVILIYMFNSFTKTALILYSIFTALLGVNLGLRITGHPYSLLVFIGFISLVGMVVHPAIFILDRINENEKKWLTIEESIIEAGYMRFTPIILSTLVTVLGLVTSLNQDEAFQGMTYTVLFGLVFSAVITLISLPILYYSLFKPKDQSKKSFFWKIFWILKQKISSQFSSLQEKVVNKLKTEKQKI